ncbi:uncharacterized protein LOC128900156 [Rissa tridactyla]|uniref:uncharacterized protein LOC128900156 n=1 Tax=Rissa tridactyla TaxID=75485 RepID=UPI0023BB1494|nr:uncharacterized protein LOC128900156 [Rissa tridactyla]
MCRARMGGGPAPLQPGKAPPARGPSVCPSIPPSLHRSSSSRTSLPSAFLSPLPHDGYPQHRPGRGDTALFPTPTPSRSWPGKSQTHARPALSRGARERAGDLRGRLEVAMGREAAIGAVALCLRQIRWSQRRDEAQARRCRASSAEHPRPGSTLGGASRGRYLMPGWRMLWALSHLGLLHLRIPQGWALRLCWELWGWGDSGVGGPQRRRHPPNPIYKPPGAGSGGLQGWRAPRCRCCCCLDGTRFFPTPSPLKGEVLRRMGNFPLCVGHCGFKAQGGLRPRGAAGQGLSAAMPVPLPLEPSRGRSGPADKALHYLCSACQPSSAAAGQRGRQPARARAGGHAAGQGAAGTGLGGWTTAGTAGGGGFACHPPWSPSEPLSPLSSPSQRQHPSPSPALAPRGMWNHRGPCD